MITGFERKINIVEAGKGRERERSKQAAGQQPKCFLNQEEENALKSEFKSW